MIAIRPREGEQGWQRYGAYLWSERQYGDFILDLEYSYPAGGNSGVFFRVGERTDPVNTGIECQILDSSEKEGRDEHTTTTAASFRPWARRRTCPGRPGSGTA